KPHLDRAARAAPRPALARGARRLRARILRAPPGARAGQHDAGGRAHRARAHASVSQAHAAGHRPPPRDPAPPQRLSRRRPGRQASSLPTRSGRILKIVILGAGRVGASVAESLVSERNDITVIDTDVDNLKLLQDRLDLRTVAGNGTHPPVLQQAGIEDADM